VVIPCSHRQDLLRGALESVGGSSVLLVDDSVQGLNWAGFSADVLRTEGALGFSGAANRGLARAQELGFSWVLLLNDDARLEEGAMEALVDVVKNRPDVDAAGPLLFGPEGLESAGLCLSPRTARLVQRKDIPSHPEAVLALSGACLFLRSHLRFDEGFPHSFEDVDLGLRIKARGQKSIVVPQARCWHEGGSTVDRRSPRATRDALYGHLRLVADSPHKRALVVGYALGQVLKEGPRLSRLNALWQAWRLS
jgi:GT2 family glycosyltransferase